MPLSGELSLGLSEKLGQEVASGLINAFNDMEAAHRTEFLELRQDIGALRAEVKQDISALRAEVKQDISDLRAEVKQDISALRAEVERDISALRSDLKQETGTLQSDLKQSIAGVGEKIAAVQSELIKWTFVFWLGTIGIVMLLLRYFSEGA